MTAHTNKPHLEDGELALLLLGPASEESTRRLRCAECDRRLSSMRQQASEIRRLVAEIDLPTDFSYPTLPVSVRARQRSWLAAPAGGWRAAAAILLLVTAAAVTVSPLRAWMKDQVAALWAELTATSAVTQGVETPAVTEPHVGLTVSFIPVREDLRLEIQHRQSAGALLLRAAAGSAVSVEVVSGGGDEMPLIQERGLQILNQPHSRADYVVAVPNLVRRVHVRLGNERPLLLTREQLSSGVRVELGTPPVRN